MKQLLSKPYLNKTELVELVAQMCGITSQKFQNKVIKEMDRRIRNKVIVPRHVGGPGDPYEIWMKDVLDLFDHFR